MPPSGTFRQCDHSRSERSTTEEASHLPAIRTTLAQAAIASVAICATLPAAAADLQARLHENWGIEIAKVPTPAEGCFTASYPSKVWKQVACKKAPARPYFPAGIARAAGGFTVGNGNDYLDVAHGLIKQSAGTFPVVSGLKSESDGGANIYSLQLNSNFFSTAVCNGASSPSNCLGWEQFVYSSSSQASFIQYWLINYGNTCPTTPYNDWNQYQGSCYRNSNAVGVPQFAITTLGSLKITGKATSTTDTFITNDGSTAYTTGGNDNVVKLATGWSGSEFNVVGDGGGSAANFSAGTHLTVRITQLDGTTLAPTCEANSGTTGETNNLNLTACTTHAGSAPFAQFNEHN